MRRTLQCAVAAGTRLAAASVLPVRSAAVRAMPRTGVAAAGARCMSTGEGKTHFGFTNVDEEKKQGMVYEVFRNVANK